MKLQEYFLEKKHRDLYEMAVAAREILRDQEKVVIVSHNDADGLSSSAIAKVTLDRAGISNEVIFVKNLDRDVLKSLPSGFKWFVDLGSGSMHMIRDSGIECLITDHHVPDQFDVDEDHKRDILSFLEFSDFSKIYQVNPHLVGLNGSYDISGSGCTFLVSLAFSEKNLDLVKPAIVGSVGDVQDANSGVLEGLNRVFLRIGQDARKVSVLEDLKFFGRTSRPLKRFLELGSDGIPGISNFYSGAGRLLNFLGIPVKDGEKYRVYNDLSEEEKRKLRTEVVGRFIIAGNNDISKLIGETYIFPDEDKNSPTWDAKEFATLLNSCGRYDQGIVGLMVAAGDRAEFYKKAISLMANHRKNLVNGYNQILSKGLKSLKNVDYFYAGKDINENIVGIIANMVLAKTGETMRPLVTMADSDPGTIKISVRAGKSFLSSGIDLADLFRRAAVKTGGVGGGHDLAAGANIPADRMGDFLKFIDEEIGHSIEVQEKTSRIRN
ncbi:hypothetical protein [Thermoplasma volcanium GSS1]|uniref:Uncharacterized protein n=1 Tax=Thermoplasma volcanium (strain ATCC 51530 / DSM 4299 / JCM 9571 / NBRC 15438 / GSS1) TaxID=273116 RepID=Q979X8_THEVO|nr:DHH family phosphoesterase [Thermoplasma volcanium]BAB60174.1 hypothetical protein [Thermoplasma volcanium GSS1]